ncbi:hypothetical protein ACQZV8_13265 [Magnetococcales bacterium HHB-1]
MNSNEPVLQALFRQLKAVENEPVDGATVTVERNLAVPTKIPDGGLIILSDGDPGEPDTTLGNFTNQFYSHEAMVSIFTQQSDQEKRDQRFSEIIGWVLDALEKDRSLGGTVLGIGWRLPDVELNYQPGTVPIKHGTMTVLLEYEVT